MFSADSIKKASVINLSLNPVILDFKTVILSHASVVWLCVIACSAIAELFSRVLILLGSTNLDFARILCSASLTNPLLYYFVLYI